MPFPSFARAEGFRRAEVRYDLVKCGIEEFITVIILKFYYKIAISSSNAIASFLAITPFVWEL